MQVLNTACNLICDPCESFLNDHMILVPQGFVKDRLRDFALPALFVTVVTLNPVSGVTTGISMAVSPMIGHVSLRLLENFGKLLSDFRGQSWNGTSVVETVLAGNFRLVGTHYLVGVMGSRQSIYRLLTTHLLYYGAINVGEATLKHFMLSISRFLRNPEIKEMLGKKITVSIINLLLKLPFIIDEEISAELNALKATLQIETEEINPPTLNEAIDLMSLETGEEEAVLPRIDPHVEAEKEGMLEELDAPVVPIPTNAGAQAFAGGHYNSTNSVVLLPKSKENNVSGQSNARNTPARQVQHLFKKSNSANWEFRKFTNLEEDPSPRFREPKPYPLNPHPSREKILPEQENIPPDTLRRSDSLRMEPSEFKLPISRTAGARELSALRSEELVPRRRHDDVSVGDMPVDGATYQNRTRSTSVDGDSGGPKYINSPSKLRKSSGNLA